MSDDRSAEAEPEIGANADAGSADADTDTGASADGTSENAGASERRGLSDRAAFWTSAVLALAISVGSVWLIGERAIHFEALNRVGPTVEGGGVGAAWVQGNTLPALEWLIVLVHFADVILGVFILVMVFLHWIAFRRLAARMRPPDAPRSTGEPVATDGGEPSEARRTSEDERRESSGSERAGGSRSSSDRRSDGGERERRERESRREAKRTDGAERATGGDSE